MDITRKEYNEFLISFEDYRMGSQYDLDRLETVSGLTREKICYILSNMNELRERFRYNQDQNFLPETQLPNITIPTLIDEEEVELDV